MSEQATIYQRATINPLLRWYLRGVLDVIRDTECVFPMGELRFFDGNDRFHKLVIVNGDWQEVGA